MVKFTAIAKKVGQVFFMVLILLFLSLIPLLVAANLLSLFRWLDDKGWSHLALLFKFVAIVLAVGTIILMACGFVVVVVLTAREIIRDFKSKDGSHAA
jgi:uncharacterized membrane protein